MSRHFNQRDHHKLVDVEISVLSFVHQGPDSKAALQMKLPLEFDWIQRLRSQIPFGLKGRHQNSPLRATNCFREMLVNCICGFCGMSQKAITTLCEWCQITMYGYIDNPDSSVEHAKCRYDQVPTINVIFWMTIFFVLGSRIQFDTMAINTSKRSLL